LTATALLAEGSVAAPSLPRFVLAGAPAFAALPPTLRLGRRVESGAGKPLLFVVSPAPANAVVPGNLVSGDDPEDRLKTLDADEPPTQDEAHAGGTGRRSPMSKVRVAINGFGRIGRCALKHSLDRDDLEVVGINDLADIGDLAYLLKYDSVHGWYPKAVESDDSSISVDGRRLPFSAERDPTQLPWGELGVDVVLECTGAFRKREGAAKHLAAGARKVAISAPSPDADGMFVLGVNAQDYDAGKHDVVSMASCTTNCLAPVAKVLLESFGVRHLMMTTVHAYTSSQSLTDVPQRKRRRGRAAAQSIVPTTTGAAKATAQVLPALAGRCDGMAFRVPVPDGSATDITASLDKEVTVEEVNDALRAAADEGPLKGILRVTDEELVSTDILGDPHSSIVDAPSTMVLKDRIVKIVSWYDNEWGYSARLVDFAALVGGSAG
jgi:glyceraldehyde 3-phosphate dehydrogenase